MKKKIIDTITFFQENRHFDLRFNILKDIKQLTNVRNIFAQELGIIITK